MFFGLRHFVSQRAGDALCTTPPHGATDQFAVFVQDVPGVARALLHILHGTAGAVDVGRLQASVQFVRRAPPHVQAHHYSARGLEQVGLVSD